MTEPEGELHGCQVCGDLFERRPDRRGRPELYCGDPACKLEGRNRNRRRNYAAASREERSVLNQSRPI